MPRSTSGKARNRRGGDGLWLAARHDFRQPVQSIELLAGNLAEAATEADRRQLAAAIKQVTASLRSMVAGLTMIARLEAGETTPVLHSVAIEDVAAAAMRSLAALPVNFTRGPLDASVMADRSLLEAAVQGCLLYATKFRVGGDVVLEARTLDGGVELAISFAGDHPEAARRDMAFVELEPAVSGGAPTVGLAPALAGRLLAVMGGSLDLLQTNEKTASIRIRLPAPQLA